MPNNIKQDGDDVTIKLGDETVPAANAPDAQGVETTTPAETKTSEDVSSQQKLERDSEELERQLKAKSRNERQLGSVAAKATKLLAKQAASGDTDAIDAIKADPELKQYMSKKHPEQYEEIFSKEESVSQEDLQATIERNVERNIEKKTQSSVIESTIRNSGVKGQENFERAKRIAQNLLDSGEDIENATSTALLAVGVNKSSQPSVPGYSRRLDDSKIIKLTKQSVDRFGFGITPKDVERVASELPPEVLKNLAE